MRRSNGDCVEGKTIRSQKPSVAALKRATVSYSLGLQIGAHNKTRSAAPQSAVWPRIPASNAAFGSRRMRRGYRRLLGSPWEQKGDRETKVEKHTQTEEDLRRQTEKRHTEAEEGLSATTEA